MESTVLHKMALPPCYYGFGNGSRREAESFVESTIVDVAIGLPFDIVAHGLLLHLLAKESGLQEGKLIGFWEMFMCIII